jgi:hypothetical protein
MLGVRRTGFRESLFGVYQSGRVMKSKRQTRGQQSYTKSYPDIAVIGPPAPTQIELCLFGPNYGECVVIHLGNGHWVVVDSCLHGPAADKEPICLAYFRSLGLDPANSIRAIIVTHWHDDHCRGISQVFRAAPAADILIPAAFTRPEFLRLSERVKENKLPIAGSKLREFSAVIEEISERIKNNDVNYNLASSRTSLYSVLATESGHGFPCEVIALSPSSGDVVRFLARISEMMPGDRQTKRSVTEACPNDVSIVTLVVIGQTGILLGADLENSTQPAAGWDAILAAHRSRRFGGFVGKASLFKIPHHGSETAHNIDVWKQLLVTDSLAALTPWRRGGGRLPTERGVKNILSQTTHAFASSRDARTRREMKQRPPAVFRELREGGARVRSLTAPFGAVRLRMFDPASEAWEIELFGSACNLKAFARIKPER